MTSQALHRADSSARSATATYGARRWPHASSAQLSLADALALTLLTAETGDDR
jgi:hypothetical protein